MVELLSPMDEFVVSLVVPLGVLLVLSGVDDLVVDLLWLLLRWRRGPNCGTGTPSPDELDAVEQKPIAIFVPAWHEHEVIAQMVENNLSAIEYTNFSFFVGVYPNDQQTLDAVTAVASRFRNVHLCKLPHDGPTSKADCLNWIYQSMLLEEERSGERFEIVVIHDSEDIIHPASFRWIAWYAKRYDFIQIPVLALNTPALELTHGVYCDEFAEFHTRDLPVRSTLGGFVPSAGVGTGYRRDLLDRMAAEGSNRLFEPGCLTEDYENGLHVQESGGSQVFVPIAQAPGQSFVATREYFPRAFRNAIRQRTRWVTGIGLQTWERRGWRTSWRQRYWLWRDRKGLLTNPLGLLTNLVFAYGLLTGLPWRYEGPLGPWALLAWTTALMVGRIGVRMSCTARVYGMGFALLVPVRILVSNWINGEATVRAIYRYIRAKIRKEALVWVKTEHQYPVRAALADSRRPIGEILVSAFGLPREILEAALRNQLPGVRLGEMLVRAGHITEEVLYQALGLQRQMPLTDIEPHAVPLRLARSLPASLARKGSVLPFAVEGGELLVCGPELPTESLTAELKEYAKLNVRYHLVTPSRFRELQSRLLDAA